MTNFEKYIKSLTPETLAVILDRTGCACDRGMCPIYNAGDMDNICGLGSCFNFYLQWFNQEAKEQ